jgi:hypothetical protein
MALHRPPDYIENPDSPFGVLSQLATQPEHLRFASIIEKVAAAAAAVHMYKSDHRVGASSWSSQPCPFPVKTHNHLPS